jgi:hypothetical protein
MELGRPVGCEHGDRMDQFVPAPATHPVAQVELLFSDTVKEKVKYPCNTGVCISDLVFPPQVKNKPHHGNVKYALILEHGFSTT